MSIKSLELTNSNLEVTIGLRHEALRQGAPEAVKILKLCSELRRLGCGALLASYDTERFGRCLFCAADLYLQLLEGKAGWPHLDPYDMARSRGQPLLDALAIGDWGLAARVGRSMEPRWREGLEYEEDFCFFECLPLLATLAAGQPPADAALQDSLDRMRRATQGIDYPRLGVLEALVQVDAEHFEEALLPLIAEHKAEVARQRKSGLGDAVFLRTEAHVFVEGIALVRLARALGLRTRSQYPLIPPAALKPLPGPFTRIALG
ncbi:Imm49 family immunity protein [Pyxidicoccus sp. 3LG]